MPSTLCICEKCYDEIQNYGERCIFVCIVICGGHFDRVNIVYDPSKASHSEEAINTMERLGFIKTLEISKREIALQPQNFITYEFDDRICYCWCKKEE